MYSPLSADFLRTITQTKKLVAKADLLYNGELTATNLHVQDWTLTIDRNATNRRSGSLTLVEPSMIPSISTALNPYGIELVLNVGVQYFDGTSELVPVGVFPVEVTSWEDAFYQPLPKIQFYDRSKTVERARALTPTDKGGMFSRDLVFHLIDDILPPGLKGNVSYNYDPTLGDEKLPGGTMFDYERWDFIKIAAEVIRAEAFFDVLGNVTIQPPPVLNSMTKGSDAAWVVSAGTRGALVKAQRSVSRTNVYNIVSVYGSVPSSNLPQPVAHAFDTDPLSATYYLGPFGQSALRINNSLLTTVGQCQQVANLKLNEATGRARALTMSCLPNPALDAGDLLLVKYADTTQELHLIDSIQMSSKGDFNIVTRTTQYQPLVGS
jgi:hypothetical protein